LILNPSNKNYKRASEFDINKIELLISKLLDQNNEYIRKNKILFDKIKKISNREVATELKIAIKLSEEVNRQIESANKKIREVHLSQNQNTFTKEKTGLESVQKEEEYKIESFNFKKIGIIRTPYINDAPYQPVNEDRGIFYIEVDPKYKEGLNKLSKFNYIYVIYYIHLIKKKLSMTLSTPWTNNIRVGVFASRSPVRPNLIGLSVVRIKKIKKNRIFTSGLDVFDGTPLIDLKPYVKDLDSKPDANYGWIADIDDYEHLLLHIKGIPHNY